MHSNTIAALLAKHTVSVMDYALGLDKPRTKGYISLEIAAELAEMLEQDSKYCAHCNSAIETMKGPIPFCGSCGRQKTPIKAAEFIKRSKEI